MFKSDKGNIELKGSEIVIKTDLACLFKSMREETSMNVDEIVQEALQTSKYSEEEIDEQIKELQREVGNQSCNVLYLIRKLISESEKED